MKKIAIGSFLAGAAAMYFADPNRGRRRRAVARDKFLAAFRDVGTEFEKAGRDVWNRAHAIPPAARSLWKSEPVDGPVLVERVRAAVGRACSHPHAIRIHSGGNGQIVIEGPVLKHELDYLMKRVHAVSGVLQVVSRLEIFNEPYGVSSLQGGIPRRALPEVAQQNWTPALRVASGAAAGAMLYAGMRLDGAGGYAAAAGSAALLARAIVNRPFLELFGAKGSGAVHFDKSIHIEAPVEEVYGYWENFENFPKFMTHLKEVRQLGDGRSHWVAAGPGGISVPWDAAITEQRENQLLAWHSVPGSLVRTEGVVRFDKDRDGSTRVSVRMCYCPPAGVVGHAVAWLFGADPKSEMDDDLVRMKSLIETGKTRAHGLPVTREQVPVLRPGAA